MAGISRGCLVFALVILIIAGCRANLPPLNDEFSLVMTAALKEADFSALERVIPPEKELWLDPLLEGKTKEDLSIVLREKIVAIREEATAQGFRWGGSELTKIYLFSLLPRAPRTREEEIFYWQIQFFHRYVPTRKLLPYLDELTKQNMYEAGQVFFVFEDTRKRLFVKALTYVVRGKRLLSRPDSRLGPNSEFELHFRMGLYEITELAEQLGDNGNTKGLDEGQP